LDSSAYLSALGADGARIASVAPGCLDRRVPACPEWAVRDLIGHLGGVYSWVTMIVQAGGEPPAGDRASAPPGDDELMRWFGDVYERVKEILETSDPDAPAWSMSRSGPRDVSWWRRRQAHETAVHRYDVEAAAGSAAAIPAELAADGVDEFLTVFLPGVLSRGPIEGLRGTVHFHATDSPGEWWLDLDSPGAAVRLEHAKADTAIRGPASALDLFLWNRLSAKEGGLETFGEAEVVDSFRLVKL
jgi:uncharacterized protein (TIGR03083 family)